MNNLHIRIKQMREERNLTQDEFSELCGLSRSSIARYELGTSIPNRKALTKLASALDTTVSVLIGEEEETEEGSAVFAEKLKSLRKERGITQGELADGCGMTRTAIARYENCSRRPTFDGLKALADFFGVSVDYLLGREEETHAKEDERRAQIRQLLDKMPEKDIEEVIRFMEFKISQKKK